MSSVAPPPPIPKKPSGQPLHTGSDMKPKRRKVQTASSLLARGEPMVWLTGGALALSLLMILGLLYWVFSAGLGTFWPVPIVEVHLYDGTIYMGEVTRSEHYQLTDKTIADLVPGAAEAVRSEMDVSDGFVQRRLIRTGNFDITNTHFHWADDFNIETELSPEWALLLERFEWGRFYGYPEAFAIDGETVAETPEQIWEQYNTYHDKILERREIIRQKEKHEIGEENYRKERARLAMRQAELDHGKDSEAYIEASEHYERISEEVDERSAVIIAEIQQLRSENDRYKLTMVTAQGDEKVISVGNIARGFPANQLSFSQKAGIYISRWWEFLTDDPREANAEGGVFPAIFGTVVMTLIMCILVVPFGVMAALYLREYAKAGLIVSLVRIAINNLAGVPSIVFGVFGLGFFIYIVGSWIDGGPEHAFKFRLPWGTWLFILIIGAVGTAAAIGTLLGSLTKRGEPRTLAKKLLYGTSILFWIKTAIAVLLVVTFLPFFDGFFTAHVADNKPVFGKTALIWASFSLALLTLPVVIVATEEALAAVPNSMREGSYACGASKWQTIRRIVLPRAMPGIMTGTILAMARGAGEVAPLMLVGAVKLAPELPFSWNPGEQFGINRSFMHLGFHIFDLGFQSQNSEAAKPILYTTTLLLILIIAILNITAIWLRSRLRRKFVASAF